MPLKFNKRSSGKSAFSGGIIVGAYTQRPDQTGWTWFFKLPHSKSGNADSPEDCERFMQEAFNKWKQNAGLQDVT